MRSLATIIIGISAGERHMRRGAPRLLPALLALLFGLLLSSVVQAQAPPRINFDHLTTGFELIGQHLPQHSVDPQCPRVRGCAPSHCLLLSSGRPRGAERRPQVRAISRSS